METFSERNNLNSPKEIQISKIDENLKIRIWNVINIVLFDKKEGKIYGGFYYIEESLIQKIWINLFNKDLDLLGGDYSIKKNFKEVFFNSQWHIWYSLIEAILNDKKDQYSYYDSLTDTFNSVFEMENSGYRIINGIISRVTSEIEMSEIKKNLDLSDKYLTVRQHISTALKFLSDTQHPHYRNSVKESISAVEALSKIITEDKKTTLGKALDIIDKKINLHAGLASGFKSIYGYTSDDSGIRHALLEKDNITYEDALFFLVSCSSFVNYLIAKFESKTN